MDGVSLSVESGQVYGFLGPNGAGKTTTVKMIAGLLYPDDGSVEIAGSSPNAPETRQIIGFMPEHPQFYQHLKAREVLEFVGELFGLSASAQGAVIKKLLQQVGLSDQAETPTRNFSKGMHQRLAFAVALINDPKLLILDEPLDGLDPIGRLDFKELIKAWRSEGRTVFFSSHILSDVEELCDRVAILDRGKLIHEGTPRELTGNKQTLEEFFVKTIRLRSEKPIRTGHRRSSR